MDKLRCCDFEIIRAKIMMAKSNVTVADRNLSSDVEKSIQLDISEKDEGTTRSKYD